MLRTGKQVGRVISFAADAPPVCCCVLVVQGIAQQMREKIAKRSPNTKVGQKVKQENFTHSKVVTHSNTLVILFETHLSALNMITMVVVEFSQERPNNTETASEAISSHLVTP